MAFVEAIGIVATHHFTLLKCSGILQNVLEAKIRVLHWIGTGGRAWAIHMYIGPTMCE